MDLQEEGENFVFLLLLLLLSLATGEEIRRLNEKIGALTSDLKKTKADIKLYGKICYVQDYNSERVISRGSKKYAEDLGSGFSSDEESKYKKM
ncbi:protein CASP-like isoform X2 [Solanum lycopersicum]|uniref:Uncharacterized protein n=2 Tax=Solanum lycopersicum TaxID=4081 RepID=A0A3Q7GJR8_SOLLC